MDMLMDVEDMSNEKESAPVSASLLCMVCEEYPKQYKCPRCDYFTCSLKCCKQHKVETQCTGKRDRAAFVSVKDFKEQTLRSDFHFLEDVLQSKDSAARTLSLSCGGRTKENFHHKKEDSSAPDSLKNVLSTPFQQLQSFPPSVKRLAKAATARNIRLVIMPQGMSKRAANTTQYRPKTDLILWRLHIVFIINNTYEPYMLLRPESQQSQMVTFGDPTSASSSSSSSSAISLTEEALVTITHPAVEESKLISEVLADFLNLRPGNSTIRHALKSLRPDRDENTLRCLIQQLPSRGDRPVFSEVPLDFTIKSVLDGKTIIEYPTLVFGSFENTKKLVMKVEEIGSAENHGNSENIGNSENNGNNDAVSDDANGIDIDDVHGSNNSANSIDGIIEISSTVRPKVNVIEKNVAASSSSQLNGNKRNHGNEMEEGNEEKKVRFNGSTNSVEPGGEEGKGGVNGEKDIDKGKEEGQQEKDEEKEQQNEGGGEKEIEQESEDESEDDEEVFLSALKEFEVKDIEALKAYINSAESLYLV